MPTLNSNAEGRSPYVDPNQALADELLKCHNEDTVSIAVLCNKIASRRKSALVPLFIRKNSLTALADRIEREGLNPCTVRMIIADITYTDVTYQQIEDFIDLFTDGNDNNDFRYLTYWLRSFY